MFYHFLYPLKDYFFGFNVFRYITFRAAMASITAFVVCLLIGPRVVRFLSELNLRQTIKREGFSALYKAHEGKDKVPTMGGLLILGSVTASTLLWGDLSNRYVLLCLFILLWLGAVGFVDDYLKLLKKDSKGLTALNKLFGQLAAGVGVGAFLFWQDPSWANVGIPFFKSWIWAMGPLYVLFVAVVITGASNAVNLTDGLDGLAIGCTVMIALTYAVFSYVAGNLIFSDYLQIPFIPGAGELTVFCAALMGAGMGFLWFNSHPASVFMGDMGSLSLGGALGAVAIFTKKELLLLIVGGVFVLEAISVILQVASYKTRKKRIFRMAPIHHHFQLAGLHESKVVIRFWIVSIILSLFGLATLKLQ
ncbi:MAG TPA: phospho-N-acetylmuramoyl-pentapeptide-transferase [Candidatus Eisenbacteria bacterium]|nr:phospho-N-acetylmuramoyl-pentapeptide-transferase [Candidatus Eisenbacteria bacterium]